MKIAFAGLLTIHGLIHLMGFAKAFHYGKASALQHEISRPLGVLWLLTAVLFVLAAVLLFAAPKAWWMPAAPAVLLSQALIVSTWSDAKFGTLANLLVLVPLVLALLPYRSTSFHSIYARDVAQGVARLTPSAAITEADLAPLPVSVQKYLRYVGVLGKPRVHHSRALFRGQIQGSLDAPPMPFTAQQTNFFDQPSRFFLLEAQRAGIPFVVLHRYQGPSATMQVKIASLISVVDASGPKMNQSETVTMLNDMCVLAPASLLSPHIRWQELGPNKVKATFSNAGNTIAAELTFNDQGELTLFTSDDRFESGDGKIYKSYRWSTPLRDYRDFGGYKLAAYGEASWKHPEGEFVYGRFELLDVQYDGAR